MLADYPLNSQVSVTITRSIPSGLLGKTPSGPQAIIRNREISWGTPQPLERYVGQTFEAVVIGTNTEYDELELSLRLIERDPWKDALERYSLGSVVLGRVVGLIEEGAFVELEPGLEGFLPVKELPLDSTVRIEDGLWIHDHVQAVVTDICPRRRQLRLSVKDTLAQRDSRVRRQLWGSKQSAHPPAVPIAEILPRDVYRQLLRFIPAAQPAVSGPQLQVLVIEDDPVYAGGLEGLLVRNGCQVTLTPDGPTGHAYVHRQTEPFELILIDWNLPGPKGHEVVSWLQQEMCPSRLVMLLEPAPLFGRPELWGVLRDSGIDIFSKADEEGVQTGIISILRELRCSWVDPETRNRHFPALPTAPVELDPTVSPGTESMLQPEGQERIPIILTRLLTDTRASSVLLLRFEPGQRRLFLEGCAGQSVPLEQASLALIHSPFQDILEKAQEVQEQAAGKSVRFRRLLELVRFEGFLGIPLPPVDSSRYGLVILREQGGFPSRQCQIARLAAYLLAGVLQERRLMRALQPWQAQNLIGQMVSSVIHEITNKLGGLKYQVGTLQQGLLDLSQWPEKAEEASYVLRLEEAVTGIAEALVESGRLRGQYLSATASDETQWVDLPILVQETLDMLRAEAQQNDVLLALDSSADFPPLWARPSLLRQICLNLLLNAIQLMGELGRPGHLSVRLDQATGATRPLQVRFIDEGPGIHSCLWERIFDFGFTSKKKGAGLGLTIARSAAHSLGGALRVEQSHLFWGTTFLLELPQGG